MPIDACYLCAILQWRVLCHRLLSFSTYSISRGIRLFILVLSVLMRDVHSTFAFLYHFTPWTFSTRTPLSDIEYADDTVLVARAQLT